MRGMLQKRPSAPHRSPRWKEAWAAWLSLVFLRNRGSGPATDDGRGALAFTFSTVALAAKLARCDGVLSREKFLAFRQAFPLDDLESARLRELFALAWEDGAEAEYFAAQVVAHYPHRPELWQELLRLLASMATADGPPTARELRFLESVGGTFGYTRTQLGRLVAASADGHRPDPFRVLGVKRRASMEEIKTQYRALMRRYHPDLAVGRLSYPEARAVAERKSAAINAAYRELQDA